MSFQVNQKFNPYQQPAMGVNAPQMPDLSADKVTQGITQNSVLKTVTPAKDDDKPWVTPLLTLPIGAGLIYGMDKFNKACATKQLSDGTTTNLLKKVSDFGAKLDSHLPFVDSAAKKVGSFIQFLDKHIVSHSRGLSAFFHAQSKPTNGMVLTMSGGTKTEIASDAVQKFMKHVELGGTLEGFAKGPSSVSIEALLNEVKKGNSSINLQKEIELLSKAPHADVIKSQLEKLALETDKAKVTEGLETILSKATSGEIKKELEILSKNVHTDEGIAKLLQICKNQPVGTTVRTGKAGKIPFTNKYLSDIIPGFKKLSREIHFSEYSNKLGLYSGLPKDAKFFQKMLPKAMMRTLEGITNGTAGGKFAVLMGAFFVADSIKKAMKAPAGNGEKRKTFFENMIYNVSWYLTMPLGLSLMHKMGGLQYVRMGAGKENIQSHLETYRKALAEFNSDVDAGKLADKAVYNQRKSILKDMIHKGVFPNEVKPEQGFLGKIGSGVMNLVYKPFKVAARLLTVGLETPKPFMPKGNQTGMIEKFVRNIGYNFKRGFGYPVRFGIFMLAISPFLAKFGAKASHVIFGKPTKSVLDEGKEEEAKKEAQNLPPLIMLNQNATVAPVQSPVDAQSLQPVQVKNNQVNNMTVNQTNGDAFISSNNAKRNVIPNPQPTRRYIPSEDGVKVMPKANNSIDENKQAKINNVVAKSQTAAAYANKFIDD